jgi:hypothetical protein
MKSTTLGFMGIALLVLTTPQLPAQNDPPFGDEMKKNVIRSAICLLHEHYIFPAKVSNIEAALLKKMDGGGYSGLQNPQDFLRELNADLEREGNDHHLNISFNPERVQQIRLDEQNEAEGKPEVFTEQMLQRMHYENFRMRKLEWLEGNVGYFQFLNFLPLTTSKQSMFSAMNFIRHSGALILDLRDNGGGDAESMNFLLGYFLRDSIQTGVWRHRKGNRTEKIFVKSDPAVQKIPDDVPVYILVNNRTSSAAEGFAYTLQQYKRAIIVGEQTKGEGNPGQLFAINDFLYIMIPTIEGLNPVTGKGIEGTGVTPDIACNPGNSLSRALLEIYTQWAASSPIPAQKQLAGWLVPALISELQPEPLSTEIAMSMAGEYAGGRKITCEAGNIFYYNTKGKKIRLDYLGSGVFQHSEDKWLRLQMHPGEPAVTWFWDDGGTEVMAKK